MKPFDHERYAFGPAMRQLILNFNVANSRGPVAAVLLPEMNTTNLSVGATVMFQLRDVKAATNPFMLVYANYQTKGLDIVYANPVSTEEYRVSVEGENADDLQTALRWLESASCARRSTSIEALAPAVAEFIRHLA